MNKNIEVEKVPYGYYESYYNNILQKSKHLDSPSTQKAKGVFFLQEKASKLASLNLSPNSHYAFKAGEVFDATDFNYPVFARPCPVNPRHGFVDSVICKNADELNIVSKKALDADPQAEILITKPIKSSHNIVFNDGVITFGPGNDGATSGKNCQYFYVDNDCIGDALGIKGKNIIKDGEGPFYEFVIPEGGDESPFLVQVRSAPHTPKCKDFVPHQVKVQNIIKADGDLLEWESRMKNVDKSNTIIDHRGGSLSSHYAIHAVINNIPIFTTYLPDTGAVVEPTAISTEITDLDRDNFFQGFVDGFNAHRDISKENVVAWARSVVITALGTLHNFAQISAMKDYRLLGQVLGLFTKVTFAVSAGESRFAFDRGIRNIEYFADYKKHINKFAGTGGRTALYKMVTDSSINDVKYIVRNCLNIFGLVAWGGSYGGPRWLSCTTSATKLYNACIKKDIHSVVELFNKVINEMHNGGKYLNKVIDVSNFDIATNSPSLFVISNIKDFVKVISKVNSLEKINNYSEFIEIPTELDKEDFEKYKASIKPKVNPAVVSATLNIPESLNPFTKTSNKVNKTKQVGGYHIFVCKENEASNDVILCVEKDDEIVLKTTLDPNKVLKTPVEELTLLGCSETCYQCNVSITQELVSKEKGYWNLPNGKRVLSKIMLNKILKANNLSHKSNVIPLP